MSSIRKQIETIFLFFEDFLFLIEENLLTDPENKNRMNHDKQSGKKPNLINFPQQFWCIYDSLGNKNHLISNLDISIKFFPSVLFLPIYNTRAFSLLLQHQTSFSIWFSTFTHIEECRSKWRYAIFITLSTWKRNKF